MSAASRAARGAVADADRILAAAAARSTGAEQRWYEHARTLLSITSERPPPRLPPPIADDSTPGALVARGMRLALTGDTAAARSIVGRLDALPSIERARLGNGARVVEALVDGRGGRWAHVVETLGPLARAGEHDATNLDRSPSLTMRWLVADAYAHLGRLDSAAVVLERATDYRRVPPGHLALRGFAYPFALRRLALWQAQRGDQSASRRAWAAFRAVFTAPDLPFRRWLGDVPRGIADGA
jgi:hypothetical protein